MSYLYLKADIYPDLNKLEEVQAAYAELIRASLNEPMLSAMQSTVTADTVVILCISIIA
jgi:hypothetical protein